MIKNIPTYYSLQLLSALSIILCMLSCVKSKKYDGDSMMNYPDMELILKENLEPFQKEPYTFRLVTIRNGKRDSSFLKASEVDWDELKKPFMQANLYKKSLDQHYDIDIFTDTSSGKMTLLLTSIEPRDITSKMSITAKNTDNKIMTVYVESRDVGFWCTREYKLLFINEKSLQIQELVKYPFSKPKTKIQTLSFLN